MTTPRCRRLVKAGRVLLVIIMAISCSQSGCSFLFVKGPPTADEETYRAPKNPTCTERNIVPGLDMAAASILSGEALAIFVLTGIGTPPDNQTEAQRHDSVTRAHLWAGGLLLAAGAWATSAFLGFHTTRMCREYVHPPTPEEEPSLD